MGKEMLSDRLKDLPSYPFMQLRDTIRRVRAEGVDLISMATGDPVEPTPSFIVEALREAALDPANHQYPTDEQRGMPAFREAVARWYGRRYGVTLDPESEVLALGGSKEGVQHVVMGLVNPGDLVLVTNPGYPGHRANVLLAGAEVHDVALLEENGFLPAIEEIPEPVARKARMMFLNYPNNPTGACANRKFLKRLVAWAVERRILLVHDTPYSEMVFSGNRRMSLLQVPGAMDIAVELNSLSKTYNMAGWRIGMAVGNARILRAMSRFMENVSSGVFNAIQLAGAAALNRGDREIEELVAVYRRRRETALRAIAGMGLDGKAGGGTFYLWIPTPDGGSDLEFATDLVENAGVLVTPGSAYGRHGKGYFRISLTVPDARMEEALDRMLRTVRRRG
jgi:LL-diaminopimelate aminotransferase